MEQVKLPKPQRGRIGSEVPLDKKGLFPGGQIQGAMEFPAKGGCGPVLTSLER